jgi:hypothetical protein
MTLQDLKDALDKLGKVDPAIEITVLTTDGRICTLDDIYLEFVERHHHELIFEATGQAHCPGKYSKG